VWFEMTMMGPVGRLRAASRRPRWRSISNRLTNAVAVPTVAANAEYRIAPDRPGLRHIRAPDQPV
jgi:hypothetical protein